MTYDNGLFSKLALDNISRAIEITGVKNIFCKPDFALQKKQPKLCIGQKEHPTEGFWKCYHRLRNTGEAVNHKKLHRIYIKMGMPLRRKTKKRLPARVKEPLCVPGKFTHTWSIDFVGDVLSNGVKLRSFNVIDDYNREVLFIETDYSLKSSRVNMLRIIQLLPIYN